MLSARLAVAQKPFRNLCRALRDSQSRCHLSIDVPIKMGWQHRTDWFCLTSAEVTARIDCSPQVDEFTSHWRATCSILPTCHSGCCFHSCCAYAQDICFAGKYAGTAEVAGQRIKIGSPPYTPCHRRCRTAVSDMRADSLFNRCRVRDCRDPSPSGSAGPYAVRYGLKLLRVRNGVRRRHTANGICRHGVP